MAEASSVGPNGGPSPPPSGGCWPTPLQERLIEAALGGRRRALSAWRTWSAEAHLDHLDPGSQRLLPLLWHNLRRHGLTDGELLRFKGIYRLTWVENQMRMRRLAEVLINLRAAGIATMVLKGLAVALTYYESIGLRPMGDVDLLIPAATAPRVMALLQADGFRPLEPNPERYIPIHHSIGFREPSGLELDLHWHTMAFCCEDDLDADFWKGAVPLPVAGASTLAPGPTEQLLHTVVHGVAWSDVPPLRWIADAWRILARDAPTIDWSRLIQMAWDRHFNVILEAGLAYLRDRFDRPIPIDVLRGLTALPRRALDVLHHDILVRSPAVGPLGHFPRTLLHYTYLASRGGAVRGILGFPSFLRAWWDLDASARLPTTLLAKAWRRLIHGTGSWKLSAASLE